MEKSLHNEQITISLHRIAILLFMFHHSWIVLISMGYIYFYPSICIYCIRYSSTLEPDDTWIFAFHQNAYKLSLGNRNTSKWFFHFLYQILNFIVCRLSNKNNFVRYLQFGTSSKWNSLNGCAYVSSIPVEKRSKYSEKWNFRNPLKVNKSSS